MSIQYLEIDSTYRDRNQFPYPGQFDVIISQTGQKNKLTAINPVSLASPVVTYIPSSTTLSYSGFGYIPSTNTNTATSFILAIPTTANLSRISNYYRGLQINFYSTITLSTILCNIDVDTWDYLTTTQADTTGNIFTPAYVTPSVLVDQFRVSFSYSLDPSIFPTIVAVKFLVCTNYYNGIVFIPDGVISSQIFHNWYIYNETKHSSAIILAYDGNNSCASIQQTNNSINGTIQGPVNFLFIGGVVNFNILTINGGTITIGMILNLPLFPTIICTVVSLPVTPIGVYTVNISAGFSTLLSSFVFNTQLVSDWSLSDTISLRQSLPIADSTFRSGCTTMSVNLSLTSSIVIDSYIGSFLRITQSGSNKEQTRIIQTYTGSPTFIATLDIPLIVAPSTGDTYEILEYTRDNFTPFNYNGTMLSQEVCYEVQLINLIMPNVSMEQGGRPVSYPYFYVELEQYSVGIPNTIYSNNPNSVRKLFRVPVTDTSIPFVNSFLTFDKSSMLKIIKFNPNSSFKFGVYLHDGRPWKPSDLDTKSPTRPNPNLQVSALFLLRRIQQ